MERMLTGIKPTGQLTLGNYVGALKNFVKYQEDYELFVFVANLHCITVMQDPVQLRKNLKDCIAIYLACGLDPEKCTIFLQSDVLEHAQLGWIMNCNTYLGELNRQTQFKDKKAKGETNLTAGLYTYPCLMAADILMYDSDYVPVGADQKQHVELARDLAERFNNRYGEAFTVPKPVVAEVGARIMSLSNPTKKMSKSENDDKGCVMLLEDLAITRKKIMSAVTDSYSQVNYDPEKQPGISNLMSIHSALSGESFEAIAKRFENKGYGEFKKEVADIVCAELEQLQAEYKRIIASDSIEEILATGAERAQRIARKKLNKIQRKMGIEIFKK